MIRYRKLLLLLPLGCLAQTVPRQTIQWETIQGTVLNGTTGKSEPENEVALFTPTGEQVHATTNENGVFKIEQTTTSAHDSLAILKVLHEGVEYFQAVHAGQATNVRVYDPSSRVKGISVHLSILQFQVRGKMLEVTELHAIDNASTPPVTSVSPDNFVLSVPRGAQLLPATISPPDGGTLRLPLIPAGGTPASYKIDFPLKPGLTRYAITYRVPYDGELVFRRKMQYPMKQIVLVAPDTMSFQPVGTNLFRPAAARPGTHALVSNSIDANEVFAFRLSGQGALSHYFRPLNPGEPPVSVGANPATAPSPTGGMLVTKPSPGRAPSGLVGYHLVVLPLTLFALAALLLRRMKLRRNFRM